MSFDEEEFERQVEEIEAAMDAPKDTPTLIIEHMSRGYSVDTLPGLLDMTDDEFDHLIDNDKDVKYAVERGEAKSKLYLEKRAMISASESASVLLAILRNRLGWMDSKSLSENKFKVVKIREFEESAESGRDNDPE